MSNLHSLPSEISVEAQATQDKANEYSKAVRVVMNELSSDKEPGSMYYAWQSNIAMTFYDHLRSGDGEDRELHTKCNEAACRFLDMFIKE